MASFNFPDDFPTHDKVVNVKNHKSVISFDGTEYIVSFFLENADTVYELPNNDLIKFVWEDNLTTFKQTAMLTFKNKDGQNFRTVSAMLELFGEKCPDLTINNKKKDFVFKNDGTDVLHVKIMPIANDDNNTKKYPKYGSNILSHTFAIIEVTDTGVFSDKEVTLELEGIETHVLDQIPERDYVSGSCGYNRKSAIPKFTKYPPSNSNTILNKDTYSADYTSESIYNILWHAYKDYDGVNKTNLVDILPKMAGYAPDDYGLPIQKRTSYYFNHKDTTPQEDKDDAKIFNLFLADTSIISLNGKDKHTDSGVRFDRRRLIWDMGSVTRSYIHIEVPQNETNYITVKRLVNYHLSCGSYTTSSSGGIASSNSRVPSLDPAILHFERPRTESDRGLLTLRSYQSYFDSLYEYNSFQKKMGRGYMGKFSLQTMDNGNIISGFVDIVKGLANTVKNCGDITDITHNIDEIKDYRFDLLEPKDYKHYIRNIAVNFLKIPSTNILYTVESVANMIEDCYGVEIYNGFGKEKATFNIIPPPPDQKPLQRETIQETELCSVSIGRNKLIQTAILMNDMITFRVSGNTNRCAGRLFNIDLPRNLEEEYLSRLSGYYWAVSILHEFDFDGKNYTNSISGVKFYKIDNIHSNSATTTNSSSGSKSTTKQNNGSASSNNKNGKKPE